MWKVEAEWSVKVPLVPDAIVFFPIAVTKYSGKSIKGFNRLLQPIMMGESRQQDPEASSQKKRSSEGTHASDELDFSTFIQSGISCVENGVTHTGWVFPAQLIPSTDNPPETCRDPLLKLL